MDAVNRSCFVTARCGSNRVRLVVKFPAQYPNNAAPTFQFVSPTTIHSSMKIKIQKVKASLHSESILMGITLNHLWTGMECIYCQCTQHSTMT